jgi:hypothetical protein
LAADCQFLSLFIILYFQFSLYGKKIFVGFQQLTQFIYPSITTKRGSDGANHLSSNDNIIGVLPNPTCAVGSVTAEPFHFAERIVTARSESIITDHLNSRWSITIVLPKPPVKKSRADV